MTAIAACTSCAAASMLRVRSNCNAIAALPCWLVDVIWVTPEIVENSRSSGSATAEAIVSGLAPGSEAPTTIVGKLTLGRSLTGRYRYAKAPKITSAADISVVITRRRMKISEKFTTQCSGWRSPLV